MTYVRMAHRADQPPDSALDDAVAIATAIAVLLLIVFLSSVIRA